MNQSSCSLRAASLLTLLLLVSTGQAQRGAMTLPRSLEQITQQADLIVQGSIVSVKVEPHPQFHNLRTVLVTFAVEDALKGKAGKTLQFRQFIWDSRDRGDSAGYRKGQQLLLMLNRPSEYGLTSPVGLEQGRFEISRDATGNLIAVNGRGNAGLLAPAAPQNQAKASTASGAESAVGSPAALRLDDLKLRIRALVGSKQ
jgi:hypothetical protein